MHDIPSLSQMESTSHSFGHLSLPTNLARPPAKVPFLGKLYDGGDMDTYPERNGAAKRPLYWTYLNGRAIAGNEEVLQPWLFFGTISHFFQALGFQRLNPRMFVYTDPSGASWITTRDLPRLMSVVLESANQTPLQIRQDMVQRARIHLHRLNV